MKNLLSVLGLAAMVMATPVKANDSEQSAAGVSTVTALTSAAVVAVPVGVLYLSGAGFAEHSGEADGALPIGDETVTAGPAPEAAMKAESKPQQQPELKQKPEQEK